MRINDVDKGNDSQRIQADGCKIASNFGLERLGAFLALGSRHQNQYTTIMMSTVTPTVTPMAMPSVLEPDMQNAAKFASKFNSEEDVFE